MNNPYSAKYFYCLLGDGELNEGQIWEAAMLAGKEKIHNLILIIDRNGIQIDGYTKFFAIRTDVCSGNETDALPPSRHAHWSRTRVPHATLTPIDSTVVQLV